MPETFQRDPRFAELDAAINNPQRRTIMPQMNHGVLLHVRVPRPSGDAPERIRKASPRPRVRARAGVVPCWACKAPDSRDAAHARGCPKLAPVPEAEVMRAQRLVLEAWGVTYV